VNEHEARASVRERREATKRRVLEWKRFEVQRSIGRIVGRDARARSPARADTRGLARRKRPRRADGAAGDGSRANRCAGPTTRSLQGGNAGLTSRAQATRRDRTRRGAGSGTRVVLGPRARDDRYDGRVSGSWMRLSKPETRPAALVSRVNASCASRCTEPAGGAGTEPRSPVSSGRRGHSEIDSIQAVAPPAAFSTRDAARGVGTHDAELHTCWERASSTRDRSVRAAAR